MTAPCTVINLAFKKGSETSLSRLQLWLVKKDKNAH